MQITIYEPFDPNLEEVIDEYHELLKERIISSIIFDDLYCENLEDESLMVVRGENGIISGLCVYSYFFSDSEPDLIEYLETKLLIELSGQFSSHGISNFETLEQFGYPDEKDKLLYVSGLEAFEERNGVGTAIIEEIASLNGVAAILLETLVDSKEFYIKNYFEPSGLYVKADSPILIRYLG